MAGASFTVEGDIKLEDAHATRSSEHVTAWNLKVGSAYKILSTYGQYVQLQNACMAPIIAFN
jgi:hypothetical protein